MPEGQQEERQGRRGSFWGPQKAEGHEVHPGLGRKLGRLRIPSTPRGTGKRGALPVSVLAWCILGSFRNGPPDGGVEGAALKWGAHGRIALAGCGGGGGSHRWEGGNQMPPLPSGLSPAASAACSLRDEAKGRAGALSWRHSTHLQ